jgi:hypothetical protein
VVLRTGNHQQLRGTLYSNCSLADGVQATGACLSASGIVLDQQGNLYYADGRYFKIRKITPQGIVWTNWLDSRKRPGSWHWIGSGSYGRK